MNHHIKSLSLIVTMGVTLGTLGACAPKTAAPTQLVGTHWQVEDVAGGGIVDNANVTLNFSADGRVTGMAACNSYFAGYETDDNGALTTNAIGSTKKMCPPALMDLEDQKPGAGNEIQLTDAMAKLMNVFSANKINPLIGSAGVSAVPMAARVSNKVGLDNNPQNFLLMHAMGPNVAGVLGSAVAAGILLALVG